MDIDIQLTRKHPENLALGEYVAGSARLLGIGCHRTRDRQPGVGSPSGAYYWLVQRHPIFAWFHLECLGLKWNERTSYDRVRMDWILSAPREDRLWFLRGLADSDGNVHFKGKSVDLTTSPNTSFVKALLDSLDVHSVIRFTRGYGAITIRADKAATAVQGMELQGWVRLGLQEDFGESLLPEVLGRFGRAHPKVRIEIGVSWPRARSPETSVDSAPNAPAVDVTITSALTLFRRLTTFCTLLPPSDW